MTTELCTICNDPTYVPFVPSPGQQIYCRQHLHLRGPRPVAPPRPRPSFLVDGAGDKYERWPDGRWVKDNGPAQSRHLDVLGQPKIGQHAYGSRTWVGPSAGANGAPAASRCSSPASVSNCRRCYNA